VTGARGLLVSPPCPPRHFSSFATLR
jgi:hypothetical protein